jgi:hypothetical protein
MKALIICPSERKSVELLAESTPLVTLSFFGKPLICHWIEHLAAQGARKILVLATDRPDQVRNIVGDGSRWGVDVEVIPESHELSVREARKKYQIASESWLSRPNDLVLADHLPTFKQNNLFLNYAAFFRTAQKAFPQAHGGSRIGLRELKPGVWVGLQARIAPTAQLIAPCWISDHVCVGDRVTVGPWAVLENRVFVDNGAEVSNSTVCAETFVGRFTTVKNSLAIGSTLINWQNDSYVKIADSFLLSSLKSPSHFTEVNVVGRLAAVAAMVATSPLALAWISAVRMRGQHVFQLRKALCPVTRQSRDYYEFANTVGFWRRWPQLWSIVRGDFCWVGNRPLNVMEASELKTDFEKLWFSVPTGLVSYADALGCSEEFSDEVRAHSAFYSAQRSWKLDFTILLSVLKQLCLPKKVPATAPQSIVLAPQKTPVPQPISATANLPIRVEGITE